MKDKIKTVQYLLGVYGEAIRADWSYIDGRTVKDDLSIISEILDDNHEILTRDEYLKKLGIEIDAKYSLPKWM